MAKHRVKRHDHNETRGVASGVHRPTRPNRRLTAYYGGEAAIDDGGASSATRFVRDHGVGRQRTP